MCCLRAVQDDELACRAVPVAVPEMLEAARVMRRKHCERCWRKRFRLKWVPSSTGMEGSFLCKVCRRRML